MKTNLLLLRAFMFVALYFTSTGTTLKGQEWVEMMNDPNANFYDIQASFNEYWEGREITRGSGYKPFKRWEYHMMSRINPDGSFPAANTLQVEREQYLTAHPATRTVGNVWRSLGPDDLSTMPQGLGRVQCVAVHPTNPNTIFVGAPTGGLWRSYDGGQTWETNTDHMQVIGIAYILFDPINPNIVYAATGDPDIVTGTSIGILKSEDGGLTWNQTGFDASLNNQIQINEMLINPDNTNILFAATTDGIYKTTNAGVNWTHIGPDERQYDIEFKPGNTGVIYSAGYNGFYKSVDGGNSFTELSDGLPTDVRGRRAIAVSPANPNIIYGMTSDANQLGSVFKSTNSGASFAQQPGSTYIGRQLWYDMVMEVDPDNAEEIYIGGVFLKKSTDGGISYSNAIPTGNYVHVDYHFLKFIDGVLYAGTDGGFYKSEDKSQSWVDLTNGLDIHQFYRIGTSVSDPYMITGGSQDNGTSMLNGGSWSKILHSDGMETIIDPNNNQTIYACIQNGSLHRSDNGGETFNHIAPATDGAWVTPYVLDPANSSTIYAGYNELYKSTNKGDDWIQLTNMGDSLGYIKDLMISPSNNNIIWLNDYNRLYKTTDQGNTWQTMNKPVGTIYTFTMNSENPDEVYIGMSGYDEGSKVYKTTDGGITWENISGTLPNVPVNDLVFQEGSNGSVYAATDIGVFYLDNSLSDWEIYSAGLPNVIVRELEIHYESKLLRAATYGRGIWEAPLKNAGSEPFAYFISDKNELYSGMSIQYTNKSLRNPDSYSWTFEGGTPGASTEENPVVAYNQSGVYNVILTVTNQSGSHTYVREQYVTVTDALVPEADFSATYTEPIVGRTVVFQDNSTNIPETWEWTFEGGTPETSTERNPSVDYLYPGTYSVSLRVTNYAGEDTEIKNDYIKVKPEPVYVNMTNGESNECFGYLYDDNGAKENYSDNTDYTYVINPTADSIRLTFTVFDLESGYDYLYLYDGVSVDAPLIGQYSETSPGIVTANSGSVTVRFTSDQLENRQGWDMYWESFGGECSMPTEAPVVDFSADNTTIQEGESVQFTDECINNPGVYSWFFPGGSPAFSNEANPLVNYEVPGVYDVKLIASNNIGEDTLLKEDYITVTEFVAEYNMDNREVADCSGFLYDAGGTSSNYSDNEEFIFIINPENAQEVEINFLEWSVENNYDFLTIYNGSTSSSPELGSWSGTNPGTVIADAGAMTLKFTSDGSVNEAGWKAEWIARGGDCGGLELPPVAAFEASATNVIQGNSIRFFDQSTNEPTNRSWYFEGGTPETSTAEIPTIIYNTPGTYSVTLTVSNDFGEDVVTQTDYITVNAGELPVANFEATSTNIDAGSSTRFNDLSENNPTSWNWTFEGGTPATSSEQVPTVEYSSPGTYTVTLTVTNQFGEDTETKTDYITVNSVGTIPVAEFSATSTTIEEGNSVRYNDLSENNPTSWNWTFEGGTPAASTEQVPTVEYFTPGTYDVSLTVANASGEDTETKLGYITVTAAGEAPVADFSASSTEVDAGFSIRFTDASTNNPTSWSWTFEGGTPATSTEQVPTIHYNTPGTYSVSLTASNEHGEDTETKTGYITVYEVPEPVTDFIADQTEIEVGGTVNFTDQTENDPISWDWTFEGGTPANSTEQNPSVTYETAGTYAVTLVAGNSVGENEITKTAYITVTEAQSEYIMSNQTVTNCSGILFDSGNNTGNYNNNENYTFVIAPEGATSVTIDFEEWQVEDSYDFLKIYDGTSSSDAQLGSWSGTSPGTVTANSGAMTLVFTSDYSETRTGWVANWTAVGGNCGAIEEAPVADFEASNVSISTGNSVVFTDLSSNTPTSWSWTFEGGTPANSTEQNPSVSYESAGIYSVTLTATNAYGEDTKQIAGYVTVNEELVEYTMQNYTATECSGKLYDSGNLSANYSDNEEYVFVISPEYATSVTINFNAWDIESGYDYLYIYDGNSTSATEIGLYSGTSPGTITSTGGALTLRFVSDYSVNKPGWDADWTSTGGNCGGSIAQPADNNLTFASLSNYSLLLYPNPAREEITLELTQNLYETGILSGEISIMDITGNVIMSKKLLEENKYKFDVSMLNQGIYLIIVNSNNESKALRFSITQ